MNRPLSLAGVAVGAAGVSAALAGLYLGMRDVMVEHGGSCVSGGPYAAAPGHTCSGSEVWVLTAAPFAGLALTWLLVGASNAWSNDRISGLGALIWSLMFGALGWNFVDLAIHPPAVMSGTGGWVVCGVVFWLMALGGLWYAQYGLRDYFLPRADGTPPPGVAPAPLVRATAGLQADPGITWGAAGTWASTPAAVAQPAPAPAGSPWVWLLTVITCAAAGAAAVAALW